jgi:hypothetical protein
MFLTMLNRNMRIDLYSAYFVRWNEEKRAEFEAEDRSDFDEDRSASSFTSLLWSDLLSCCQLEVKLCAASRLIVY